ncbi:MAG: sigma factor, partial [Candidatus Dormiibacterota bacterium]
MQFHEFNKSYLERLCSGDFRTETHFVAYFSELIQLKLRSRVKSPQAVEDLRQETFARVFATLRSQGIRQPERLGAFVNSVCNNVLLEHYRSASRENLSEEEESANVPDPSLDVVAILS